MPRNDRNDKQNLSGDETVKASDFGGIIGAGVNRGGEMTDTGPYHSDAAAHVLVRKFTENGIPYEEQKLLSEVEEDEQIVGYGSTLDENHEPVKGEGPRLDKREG